MAWTNKHLNIRGNGIANGDLKFSGKTPNVVRVTMANGVAIKDGWGNTVSAGSLAVLWRKEFTATFTNYDALPSTQFGGNTLYYGISATDAGISIGTPSKNSTDYIDYDAGYWSPALNAAVTSDTTYQAKYTEIYFGKIITVSAFCNISINSLDSRITYTESNGRTIWRIPVSLGSVSFTYTCKNTGYAFDSSGTQKATVTYSVPNQDTSTYYNDPTYVKIINPQRAEGDISDIDSNNTASGYRKIGSTFICTCLGLTDTIVRKINSSTDSSVSASISSDAPTIQTTIHLVSQCGFSGSGSSDSNETVSKDITCYVYRSRTSTTTRITEIKGWTFNGVSVSSGTQYSFTVAVPGVLGYSTGDTTESTTYSAWEYTGGSSFTLPTYSELSSRSYNLSTTTTFKWDMSNAVWNSEKAAISSPYTVSGTKITTFMPSPSSKWYVLNNASETYALGGTYTVPITRVTDGKLITLRLDAGSSSVSYTKITSPYATIVAQSFTRTVTIYRKVGVSDFMSNYIGTTKFGGTTIDSSGFSYQAYGSTLPSAWTWQSSSTGISYSSQASVPADGSTYTAIEGTATSVANPTFTVPTSGNTAQYGYFMGLSTSDSILSAEDNNVSGTVTLTSDMTYYAWYMPVSRKITFYNNATGTLTINGTDVAKGGSTMVSVYAGTTSSFSISSSASPALKHCIAACDSSTASTNTTSFGNGISVSGNITRTGGTITFSATKYEMSANEDIAIYFNTIFESDYS